MPNPEAAVSLGLETVFAGQGAVHAEARVLGHCEEDDDCEDCFDPEPECQDCFETDDDDE